MSTCLAIAWLALPVRTAAAAGGLTLADAVRRAVENAPQIEAGRAAIEAASQDLRRAGRLPDPMLAIGIADLPVSGRDAFDPDADAMTEKTIVLQQGVPARAKRAAQRAVATRAVELAMAEAGGTRLDVERAAANAWVGAWSAARELEALGALRAQAQLALRLTRARAAGGGSALDVLAAEAAVLDLDGETAAAEGASGEALAELQRWVGDGTHSVATDAPDFGRAPLAEAAALTAVDRQPALQAAAARTAAADAALDAARAGRRPDWNVAASYGQRSGFDDMLMLEVGVSLPFFTRDRQGPDIAARRAEQQGALARQESLRRELAARIRAGYSKWEGLRRQVEAHDQVLRLAGDRSAAALASYRAGGELRAWLDARRDEVLTHRSHAQHRAALGRAWVELAYLYGEQAP
ncbi:MAG: TolC family protein [Steroidobacteraceae bacterium]